MNGGEREGNTSPSVTPRKTGQSGRALTNVQGYALKRPHLLYTIDTDTRNRASLCIAHVRDTLHRVATTPIRRLLITISPLLPATVQTFRSAFSFAGAKCPLHEDKLKSRKKRFARHFNQQRRTIGSWLMHNSNVHQLDDLPGVLLLNGVEKNASCKPLTRLTAAAAL